MKANEIKTTDEQYFSVVEQAMSWFFKLHPEVDKAVAEMTLCEQNEYLCSNNELLVEFTIELLELLTYYVFYTVELPNPN